MTLIVKKKRIERMQVFFMGVVLCPCKYTTKNWFSGCHKELFVIFASYSIEK